MLSVYHDLLDQPAIGPLLLMARVTERIRLGPAALNPFTLHPYEIAGQIATLDAVSCGRARAWATMTASSSTCSSTLWPFPWLAASVPRAVIEQPVVSFSTSLS